MKKELFDELLESMNEAVEHSQSKLDLRTTERMKPPKPLRPKEIVALRDRLHISQPIFASMLNVSVKTVQAWEQGTRKPDGAALRLLELASLHPELLRN